MLMKSIEHYDSPQVEILGLYTEGVLCASGDLTVLTIKMVDFWTSSNDTGYEKDFSDFLRPFVDPGRIVFEDSAGKAGRRNLQPCRTLLLCEYRRQC